MNSEVQLVGKKGCKKGRMMEYYCCITLLEERVQ
jgi:hypothetical protein